MWWQRAWYRSGVHPLLWLLWPLQVLYRLVVQRRRQRFLQKPPEGLPVPVVIVGNLTVGGAGKTPTVVALVEWLQTQGHRPGVIARGYGGKGPFPQPVTPQSATAAVGDEPRLIVLRTGVTMVVDPDRSRAAATLLELDPQISIIVSDDGLQHYALPRDIELVVVDGERLLGNQKQLPLGPLRESARRLSEVDLVVQNGGDDGALRHWCEHSYRFELTPLNWRRVSDGVEVSELPAGERVAIAGIANPSRFFDTLRAQNQQVSDCHAFADHHPFTLADFAKWSNSDAILMTEKDAVKCQSFAQDRCYYLPVKAQFSDEFWSAFQQCIDAAIARRQQ
ncbi:tetraacyldisaccharide 4'-kinase [Pseudidiomarina aestuarii]|uniref:Tetraacyldisaccharide 4'-kinase n=1 Tax=Pseudidiomarina aestuarii TaxID=624146 RepID=A0A7Z7ET97_9GAMM|nr:tetraacyldisaccharide 4'-kinase [Pseudidiomarina aestuarii]RUO40836.1 tetraacyldisaccharide 4'-kinase [Pseudidiomarina aestuarii]